MKGQGQRRRHSWQFDVVKHKVLPTTCQWRHRGGVQIQLYSFFNLDARLVCVVNATPRPIYPRQKRTPVPIVQEAGWVSEPIWKGFDGQKVSFPNRGANTLPSSPQQVGIPTTIKHDNMFIMCITTTTCFGLFYKPSWSNSWHTCVLCHVLPDDGPQNRPKHVAVVIHMINILSHSMGKKENISWNVTA